MNSAMGRRDEAKAGMAETGDRPTVLFIGQMGQPGTYDPALFVEEPGGDDEVLWFDLLLAEIGVRDRVDYSGVRVALGEELPAPEAVDAVVVGGSFHSVHDGLDWQARLVDWLASWRTTGGPLFGICGGHQTVSRMAGGAVDFVPDGPRAGTFAVDLTPEGQAHFLFQGMEEDIAFHFGNFERVAAPPPGAAVLATAEGMPAAALDHGGFWYSVQFHPEATHRCLGASWAGTHPEFRNNYRPTPLAPLIFRNFLTGTGILQT